MRLMEDLWLRVCKWHCVGKRSRWLAVKMASWRTTRSLTYKTTRTTASALEETALWEKKRDASKVPFQAKWMAHRQSASNSSRSQFIRAVDQSQQAAWRIDKLKTQLIQPQASPNSLWERSQNQMRAPTSAWTMPSASQRSNSTAKRRKPILKQSWWRRNTHEKALIVA